MENEIIEVINKNELPETMAENLKQEFLPFYEKVSGIKDQVKNIKVESADQVELMSEARGARLSLKKIRTETENRRKKLKADIVLKGKAIDGMANIIKHLIVPLENHLQDQEDFIKIQREKERARIIEDRENKLSEFVDDITVFSVGDMSEDAYNKLLENSRVAYKARIQAEQEAEKERAEKERKQKLLSEREKRLQPLGNFVNWSAVNIDMTDADFEKVLKEAEDRAEKDFQEKKKLKEKAKKEKAKADQERREREAAEQKIREQEKAEQDRKAAEAEAARRAALAPDREKLKEYLKSLMSVKKPVLQATAAKKILNNFLLKMNEAKKEFDKAVKNI